MSTLLFPELAREMAGSNHRVGDSLEAESRRLTDLQQTTENRDALAREAARSARSAMAAALRRHAEALDFWQSALDDFRDGVTDVRSKAMLENVRAIIDSWLRLARFSREMALFAGRSGNPLVALGELDAAEAAIREVQSAVEKMSDFLNRPRPAVDAAILAAGREEIAQGRYRTAEQLRAAARPSAEGR
jgi:tetratricopeptide (TPR) repeat protein